MLDYSYDIFKEFNNQKFGKISDVKELRAIASNLEKDMENWLFSKCDKIQKENNLSRKISEETSNFLRNIIICIEDNIEVLPGVRIRDKKSWIKVMEDLLCKNANYGIDYAVKVIKGRWEPCEQAIADYDYYENILEYTRLAVKGRWHLGEKLLIEQLKRNLRNTRSLFGRKKGYSSEKVEKNWFNLNNYAVGWDAMRQYSEIIDKNAPWKDLWKNIWLSERLAA